MKKLEFVKCANCTSRPSSIFYDLEPSNLETLDKHKTCNTFKKGQIIFNEGNRPLGLYCIKKGKVKIYKTGIEGKEQIVRLAKDGDLVGYRSFLSNENYSASSQVMEDSQICFIDKEDFRSAINHSSFLNQNIIHLLSRELRESEELVRDMAQKSVRERLAEILLIIKEKFGCDEDQILQTHLTREELANYVGTATETLIRLLSDLKEEKVLATKGRKIQIIDLKRLVEIANLDI